MRRVFTVLGFSCVLVTAAHAQVDHIGLYNDPQGSCNAMIPVPAPAFTSVHVVHKFNGGTSGVQFMVQDNSGLLAVSQTSPYYVIGVWNNDWAFNFQGCVIGDHLVATLNFLWFGTPITGCTQTLQVFPAPTSQIPGLIVVEDCGHNVEVATGGTFYFEATPLTCGDIMGCLPPLSTQSATWGSVKALYR